MRFSLHGPASDERKLTCCVGLDDPDREKEEEEAEEGTYVNYEIEVAYHAQPGLNVKHHNIQFVFLPLDFEVLSAQASLCLVGCSLLLEFFMSVKDLFKYVKSSFSLWGKTSKTHIGACVCFQHPHLRLGSARELPRDAAVETSVDRVASLHRKCEARLDLARKEEEQADFHSLLGLQLMFTFMGLPAVSISVQPLNKGLPNVLDLPFLNDFVQSSIAAACNAYVAPKSMTLNIGEILMGTGTKLDTDAMGVLQVTLHRAVDLESRDADGGSDPYVVCSFASLGKALYTSQSYRLVDERHKHPHY